MAEEDARPPRKGALFGVQRAYVDALEQTLDTAEEDLAATHGKNVTLTAHLESARLALGESAGWSKRLPAALRELATLAAGHLDGEHREQRLAAAVLALAGEHLLASVDVFIGEPAGELERNTRLNENGRPVGTIAQLGACSVNCTWQPGIDVGADTTQIVEGLCAAVVCSLAGVATLRVERNVVTQLGDKRALSRHLALRYRLEQPCELVAVSVDAQSAIAYRELFGRLAWDASLAGAASVLDRLARAHGGQAYQTGDKEFRLLTDLDQAELAQDQAAEALEEYDGLIFRVSIAQR